MDNPPNLGSGAAPSDKAHGGVHASMWGGGTNPWVGHIASDGAAQSNSTSQNQMEMDTEDIKEEDIEEEDIEEEEQVSQLLNTSMFRIVIPGSQDPRSLFPTRASYSTGAGQAAPANATNGLLQTIRREIRSTVQESVQSYMQATIGTALKDSVGQALAEYHHGVQTKDEDADDEFDFGSPPSGGSRRKKSKRENEYHNVLRGYLSSKGLWVAESGTLPKLPPSQAVDDFVTGRANGPDIEDPRFDWTESFSHVWNDELLGMLAEDWISIIEQQIGRDELPERFFNLGPVKRLLVAKLRNIKAAFLRRYDHMTGELEETDDLKQSEARSKEKSQLKSRHTSRANGTYLRRSRIIKHFLQIGNDPEFWTAMEELVDALGRKGMSSDESEEEKPARATPYSRGRKIVRRIPLRWLRGDIAILWKHVEDHYRFIPASQKRGNPPFDRVFEAEPGPEIDMTVAQHLVVVKNLPTNWYDPVYWSHLTSQGKRSVSRTAPKPLPVIPVHDINMND